MNLGTKPSVQTVQLFLSKSTSHTLEHNCITFSAIRHVSVRSQTPGLQFAKLRFKNGRTYPLGLERSGGGASADQRGGPQGGGGARLAQRQRHVAGERGGRGRETADRGRPGGPGEGHGPARGRDGWERRGHEEEGRRGQGQGRLCRQEGGCQEEDQGRCR